MARAKAALDHGPGLARPPLCSLECFACRDPASCSASARARSFWRRCLDQHHALPYVVALARAASAAGDVRFSRTQLPHICERRRQTGHLFLQPGHRESSRGVGREKFLSPAVFPRANASREARRFDFVFLEARRGCLARDVCSRFAGAACSVRLARLLSRGALLPLYGLERQNVSWRNSSRAVAASVRIRENRRKHRCPGGRYSDLAHSRRCLIRPRTESPALEPRAHQLNRFIGEHSLREAPSRPRDLLFGFTAVPQGLPEMRYAIRMHPVK